MIIQLANRFVPTSTGLNTGALAVPNPNLVYSPNYQVPPGFTLYVMNLTLSIDIPVTATPGASLSFGYNSSNANAPTTYTDLIPWTAALGLAAGGQDGVLAVIPAGNWPQVLYNGVPTTSRIFASLVGLLR